jgi:hypothetical protein
MLDTTPGWTDSKWKELEAQFAEACAGFKKGEKQERLGREKSIDCAIRSGKIANALRDEYGGNDWMGDFAKLCEKNDVAMDSVYQWRRIAKRLAQLGAPEDVVAKCRELGWRKSLDYLNEQYDAMKRNRFRDCQNLESLREDLLEQKAWLYGQYRERLTALKGDAVFQDWYQGLSDRQREDFDQPTLAPLPEALRPSVDADDNDDRDW